MFPLGRSLLITPRANRLPLGFAEVGFGPLYALRNSIPTRLTHAQVGELTVPQITCCAVPFHYQMLLGDYGFLPRSRKALGWLVLHAANVTPDGRAIGFVEKRPAAHTHVDESAARDR